MSGRESGHGPSASVDPDSLEVAPGTAHEKLEGSVPSLANEEDLRKALEQAFDYRGDVSITRKDGAKIEGYIFDRSEWNRPRRQLRAIVAERWISQDKDFLRRDCRSGFYRAATWLRARVGKTGCVTTGRRRRQARRIFRCSRRSWSSAWQSARQHFSDVCLADEC